MDYSRRSKAPGGRARGGAPQAAVRFVVTVLDSSRRQKDKFIYDFSDLMTSFGAWMGLWGSPGSFPAELGGHPARDVPPEASDSACWRAGRAGRSPSGSLTTRPPGRPSRPNSRRRGRGGRWLPRPSPGLLPEVGLKQKRRIQLFFSLRWFSLIKEEVFGRRKQQKYAAKSQGNEKPKAGTVPAESAETPVETF